MTGSADDGKRWFTVRCLFAFRMSDDRRAYTYEERITLWRAAGFDDAIALAEVDAAEYSTTIKGDAAGYLGLAQCHELADDVGHGAEVFSLMRDSQLSPGEAAATVVVEYGLAILGRAHLHVPPRPGGLTRDDPRDQAGLHTIDDRGAHGLDVNHPVRTDGHPDRMAPSRLCISGVGGACHDAKDGVARGNQLGHVATRDRAGHPVGEARRAPLLR